METNETNETNDEPASTGQPAVSPGTQPPVGTTTDGLIGVGLIALVGAGAWYGFHFIKARLSDGALGVGFLLALFFLYLLPTFIAGYRNAKFGLPAFIVNLFLGWTFVGWVAALVLAVL